MNVSGEKWNIAYNDLHKLEGHAIIAIGKENWKSNNVVQRWVHHGKVHFAKRKMVWYTKTIVFFGVRGLKVVAKFFLNWDFLHDDLFYLVKYSNVEYQVEIFKTYH